MIKGMVSPYDECIDFEDVRNYGEWDVSIYPIVTRIADNELKRNNDNLHVSDLVISPRQYWLKQRHDIYLPYEAWADRYLGTCVHNDIAQADVGAHELLLVGKAGGVDVEGMIDYIDYSVATIVDYKTCQSFLAGWILNGRKDKKTGEMVAGIENWRPEWTEQVNMYRWLCKQSNIEVRRAVVCLITKDGRGDFGRYIEIEIPFIDNIEALVTKRIEILQAHEDVVDDYLPMCDDRWENDLACREYCDVRGFCDYAQSLPMTRTEIEKGVEF